MKTCNCWNEKDDGLRKLGLKLSNACSMLELVEATLDIRGVYGLPLQRTDGKKLRSDDPKLLQISYCPFCGTQL
jgi:hypothetical protein